MVGKVELGQGIVTALAQIAADELGVPLEKIRMLPASTAYSPDEGVTSGSQSVSEGGKALRLACAEARGERTPEPGARVVGTSAPRRDLPGKFAGAPELRAGHGAAGDAAWARGAAHAWLFQTDLPR